MLSRRKLAQPLELHVPVMTMGQPTCVLAVGSRSRSDTRTSWPAVRPLTVIRELLAPELSVITVVTGPAPNSDGPSFAMPEPVSVSGWVIESVPAHVHDPAGMTTVSPAEAESTAF